jgi:hypothetical protein
MALADALELEQLRMLPDMSLGEPGELVVAMEFIEARRGQGDPRFGCDILR